MSGTKEKMDTVEKEFTAFPDIAADIINALLYQGESLVNAENLWPGLTETIYQGKERLRDQYEDLSKYEVINGRVRMMYLIANQSKVDGKMLLRKAGYTGGVYREQYEGKIKDIFPVIEFVLYWGQPRWRSSRELKKYFDKWKLLGDYSDKIWKHVDNIELHVYEMRHLPEETRKLFQSDMRIVVDFLAEGWNYRSDRKIKHKAALIKMIKVLSGDSNIEDVEKWMEEQKIREEDEMAVCELFDQYVRQGRREGREEGLTEGFKRGEECRLVADIENAMKYFQVTLEKACEGLGTTVARYEEAKRLFP